MMQVTCFWAIKYFSSHLTEARSSCEVMSEGLMIHGKDAVATYVVSRLYAGAAVSVSVLGQMKTYLVQQKEIGVI